MHSTKQPTVFLYSLFWLYIGIIGFQGLYAQTNDQTEKIKASYNLTNLEALKFSISQDYHRTNAQVKRNSNYTKAYKESIQDIGTDGTPLFYTTFNNPVSSSSRANFLHENSDLGAAINGSGMTIGVWDAGQALNKHSEFDSRATITDVFTETNNHATMVTGTLIASGINNKARGVAYGANAVINNWRRDRLEVIEAAINGLLISNHSYGIEASQVPDWYFGSYINITRQWDEIMFNAPYYIMVTAAGNAQKMGHNQSPLFGSPQDGYDQLLGFTTAKNGITVAAADIQVSSYGELKKASVTNYSSFGPTDDGRIKPDLAASGTNPLTTTASGINQYGKFTGTSMATPGVSGSMLLLQQYFQRQEGSFMKAATLKGLVLHTADDVDAPGPDYRMGWGIINTEKAANLILNKEYTTKIIEAVLKEGETYSIEITAEEAKDLSVSISWTDPAGTNINDGDLNKFNPVLVNDLDLRLIQEKREYYPWKLKASRAIDAATKGDNTVDVFEKIDINNANGKYVLTISHKGKLENKEQHFSLIVSGIKENNCVLEAPTSINIIKASSETLKIGWELQQDASYQISYKIVGQEKWNYLQTSKNTIAFDSLKSNTNYEVNIKTYCTQNRSSEESETYSFNFKGVDTELIKTLSSQSYQDKIKLVAYPNPVVHALHIKGDFSKECRYRIVQSNGLSTPFKSLKNNSVEVVGLAAGYYILEVQESNKEVTHASFIKN